MFSLCSSTRQLNMTRAKCHGRTIGMETIASILHADLDAFYASVEQLLDPSLRGKPIAVGGGVVLAASYEAKAFGVRGGMPGRQARGLCPQLIFVNGHFKDYQRRGDAAIKVVSDFTSLVLRIQRREPELMAARTKACLAVAREQGFAYDCANGSMLEIWHDAWVTGRCADDRIEAFRSALTEVRRMGIGVILGLYHVLFAECLEKQG